MCFDVGVEVCWLCVEVVVFGVVVGFCVDDGIGVDGFVGVDGVDVVGICCEGFDWLCDECDFVGLVEFVVVEYLLYCVVDSWVFSFVNYI